MLARRGWEVTGIDVIPKAVSGARRRADETGVVARFVEGSVTALRDAGVGTGYRLVLDVEWRHARWGGAGFSGWRIVGERPYRAELPPPLLRSIEPRWYCLARA